jgi:hypothetical protein
MITSPQHTKLASEFLARSPTLLGVYEGASIYEHPTLGEEGPMIAIIDGRKRLLMPDCELEDIRLHGIYKCISL